jgi:hypothetical protein
MVDVEGATIAMPKGFASHLVPSVLKIRKDPSGIMLLSGRSF